ncbi:MAG: nuclear transport factor 2 family protein [Gemmatales bacterium]
MLKYLLPALCLCCCSAWAMSPQDAAAKPAVSAEEATVTEILKVYADVYNKHDVEKLIEYWSPNAVAINTDTGSRVVGRDALKAAFQQSFKAQPEMKLAIRLKHFRFIKPDFLSIEGESVVTNPSQDPDENTFSAILVKVGDKWQIEQASESPLPTPATPYDGLKGIEWMVGTWADDSKGVSVESVMSWNPKKTLLIRKYTVQYENETEPETGTQVIAWDSRAKTIRSLSFSSDGSFGEGTWSSSDNEWRVKFNYTTTEGSLVSGTQVLTKVDDNTIKVQTVGQEIDGELVAWPSPPSRWCASPKHLPPLNPRNNSIPRTQGDTP